MTNQQYAIKHLSEAIATMRSFLNSAENALDESDPARSVESVVHQFAWGNANAMSSIESAMSSARKHDIAATRLGCLKEARA